MVVRSDYAHVAAESSPDGAVCGGYSCGWLLGLVRAGVEYYSDAKELHEDVEGMVWTPAFLSTEGGEFTTINHRRSCLAA